MTLWIASHDALVDEYADEILDLQDGQIAPPASRLRQARDAHGHMLG